MLVTDRIDERLVRATACGADAVVNTAREPLPEALRRLGVDDGPTLVIDAVCHPSILEEAVRLAAPAGRIGMLGFSAVPSAIPQQETTRKELSLFASRLNCGMFPRVIEWMKAGRLRPRARSSATAFPSPTSTRPSRWSRAIRGRAPRCSSTSSPGPEDGPLGAAAGRRGGPHGASSRTSSPRRAWRPRRPRPSPGFSCSPTCWAATPTEWRWHLSTSSSSRRSS